MEVQTRERSQSGQAVNLLSSDQIDKMIERMRNKGKLVDTGRGLEKSRYVVTGPRKHGQVDCRYVGLAKKVLVHQLYWRYKNNYAPINPELHISHCDKEPEVLNLVAESSMMNESRKYCHLFNWYKPLPNEDWARCPHWEHLCTGP